MPNSTKCRKVTFLLINRLINASLPSFPCLFMGGAVTYSLLSVCVWGWGWELIIPEMVYSKTTTYAWICYGNLTSHSCGS